MSLKYLLKRLGYTLFILLFVITFNFILFRLIPGDPIDIMSRTVTSDPNVRASLMAQYGLDKPMLVQYFNYIRSMLTFDFGTSFQYNQPVMDILMDKIGNTMLLEVVAVPLGLALGIAGGIYAASRHGKRSDVIVTSTTMLVYAIPSFWLAMVFILIFCVKLGWLPLNGMFSHGVSYANGWEKFGDIASHMALPVLSEALTLFGGYLMIMRGAMLDILGEDYVQTARAKGLTERQILRRHIVPNALLPTSNMVVMSLAFMFTGSFAIEVLFTWPGMGKVMVESVTRRDYPMLQATNYIIALMVIVANFFLDILYTYLDPRVKVEG